MMTIPIQSEIVYSSPMNQNGLFADDAELSVGVISLSAPAYHNQ